VGVVANRQNPHEEVDIRRLFLYYSPDGGLGQVVISNNGEVGGSFKFNDNSPII
jgi:hypothetical protein